MSQFFWKEDLSELAAGNDEYAAFNRRIVNTKKQVLGVRMPDLRRLAKRVAKGMTAADAAAMYGALDESVYEEVLLFGLVLNAAKLTETEHIALTRRYLEKVDSWAGIDVFAEKNARFSGVTYWQFALEMLHEKREFFVRYGIVACMANFLTDEKIAQVFAELRMLKSNAYYVRMAAAWLYATAAVRYYEITMLELQNTAIDPWARRKAYQKMLESRQMSETQKGEIRLTRRLL
jgi:3-methyladenine DNA glycosylase AlkD